MILTGLRYLLAENAFDRIVVYEQRSSVGGVWNYTPLHPERHDSITSDSNRSTGSRAAQIVTKDLPEFNTPMYDGLEANLPHMLMQFSDAPFPVGTQLFPRQEAVMQYLQGYASDVISLIRFRRMVMQVKPVRGNDSHGWEVTTKSTAEEESQVELFDAVIAANGHCDRPLMPDIDGLDAWSEKFPESLYHSVSYKNPRAFKNKVS